MKRMLSTIALVASVCVTPFASAQTTPWSVKLGYNYIMPQEGAGNLSAPSLPGTTTSIGNAGAPILTLGYAFAPNIEVELMTGLGYRHEIRGAGAIDGVGKLGEIDAYPPTLLLKYRFLDADRALRPFVSAGVTYAFFRNSHGSSTLNGITGGSPSNPTSISVDSAWGMTLAAGANWNFDKRWFLEGMVMKTFLKTDAHLSTGQSQSLRLDPVSINLAVGYRF